MMRQRAVIVCLLSAGLVAAVSGCGKKGPAGEARQGAPVVAGVVVQEVSAGAIPEQIEAVGTVRAKNTAQLAARIPATVSGTYVHAGERVAKGKLLVTLESAEAVSGAAGARAAVDEAERGVADARARKKLADVTFDRYEKLLGEQAVTKQEFDVRRMERDVAAEGFARAEARLVQAREEVKSAAAVAGYTRITAPIAGIVTSKPVEAGMTVFPGTPLVTVEEGGGYRLEVNAPETLSGKIKTGDRVVCAIDGIGAETPGKVAEVVPTIDPASRTFTVKVAVAAPGLRSGIYGRAFFPAGVRPGLSVPRVAVVERGTLASVWVAGKDDIVRMRLVKVGRAMPEDRVEILSGLSAGERVVVNGTDKVTDGVRIR
jgi:membrane fusion protein, multidrug efflux system